MLRTKGQVDFVDASLFITKMTRLPLVESKVIAAESQAFQFSVQTQGRRVIERARFEMRVAGRASWMMEYLFGYSTHRTAPILLMTGDVLEVSLELRKDGRWWRRLVDAVFDWWTPPKARVYVTGVARRVPWDVTEDGREVE